MGFVKLVLFFCGPMGWIALAILSAREKECSGSDVLARKPSAQSRTSRSGRAALAFVLVLLFIIIVLMLGAQ